jgi:FkbM family methyltransferase
MTWEDRPKRLAQRLAHRVGVHLVRWPLRFDLDQDARARRQHAHDRRQRLLQWLGVNVLFDVGANFGGYAATVRKRGYQGQIVSFEPLTGPFRELEVAAQNDPRWAVRHVGVGATPGEAEINLSASTGQWRASSILPMTQRHIHTYPDDRPIGTERIRIETLDSAAAEFLEPSARVAVNIDVQGYELEVLRGGSEVLRQAVFVETEMDLVELYHGQPGFEQLVNTFYDAGFRLASFEPVDIDHQTGAIIWGDGIFVRDT